MTTSGIDSGFPSIHDAPTESCTDLFGMEEAMPFAKDSCWMQKYKALKAYILERGHLPDKHVVENRALLSWAKYQRKKLKEGTLDADKVRLFGELMALRKNEHTGGRRKQSPSSNTCDRR